MPLPRLPLAAFLLFTTAVPALADAVTYEGTIGNARIALELSSAVERPGAKVVGRYFYRRKGIDIPLDAVSARPGEVQLTEEAPCTEATCFVNGSDIAETAPVAARWSLFLNDGGRGLTGTWTGGGKTLPIKLSYVGSRPFEAAEITPLELATISLQPDQTATGESPYEDLRMEVDFEQGPEVRWGDLAFTYVVDPRTRFAYPRLIAAGEADLELVNEALRARHDTLSALALSCGATQYLGLGWYGNGDTNGDGLGGYPDELVEVQYLSPTVMSWMESGSIFCGGAHPWNHMSYYNLDLRTGKDIDLSRIFRGVTPNAYMPARVEPDPALVRFVLAHRTPSGDAELDEECGYDELIPQYLSISFKQPDTVVFGLDGLPNVIQACAYELYQSPIAELADLLVPTAAEYFPALRQ